MTAVNQNYARKYKIPIDLIAFKFDITTKEDSGESFQCESYVWLIYLGAIDAKPDDGAYINGLFMEGAMWDR